MGTVWKTAGIRAGGVVVGLALASGGYWGGIALFTDDPKTSEVSDVFTVTSPTETTAPPEAPPTTEPTAPVVQPAPVETAPAPEVIPAPQPPADGSLPDGWLPPSSPGGPPTAPMPPPPVAPCIPGEGGQRCAPDGG